MSPNFVTLVYKQVSKPGFEPIDVHLDVYRPASPPPGANTTSPSVPAVIYFHGGGLTVGNRQSWFPTWLHKRATAAGYAFISADYQLVTPATGHEIVRDIQDLLEFLATLEVPAGEDPQARTHSEGQVQPSFSYKIDPEAMAVAGSSAGGLCAYLAAMHCDSPKPRALISMYGMGGNFLTPHFLTPKTKPFFRGREMLDPRDFLRYLHPNYIPDDTALKATDASFASLQPIADSPLAYHPQTYRIPGYPANPRMLLTRLYLQLGIFIDYYTGAHENGGLSVILRDALDARPTSRDDDEEFLNRMRALIPPQHHALFPQLGVSARWPPVMLVHGTEDTAVPVGESRSLARLLSACGVTVEVMEVEGVEHSFDYESGAEKRFGEVFDQVGEFLGRLVFRPRNNRTCLFLRDVTSGSTA
ncbi:putative alpha/beta hydrolase fold [Lyophyllum shimeji]|uniref:Alpha/beta hydrolase fold n=1 Tax=Lyophyllum shimeji TaxID=47721 RepID=A0A9P3PNH7_LYOSH|nr:putative alpha/beta hydrolase fold [Lyophyllum shimeji]